MATRPTLHRAVAKTKNTASNYNDNFDLMMDFIDNSIGEAKDYVDDTLAGNVFSRNIGEIVQSAIPLTDAGLHLLDGALISGSGAYSAFVTYISGLVTDYPDLFVTEADWQTSVTTYGVCGKFVYDSVNNTVRLPKITGIIEGTTDVTALGDLVEAGLPNITGKFSVGGGNYLRILNTSGAFSESWNSGGTDVGGSDPTTANRQCDFNASNSSSIYGNSTTVQPQTIKCYYYIVIATSTKTDIEVDIDEIATDLNGKADVDFSNANPNQTFIDTSMDWCGLDGSRELALGVPSSGSPYTLPSAGYIIWVSYWNSVGDRSFYYITPNQTTPRNIHIAVGYEYTYLTPLFPKGTIVYDGGNTTAMYFVPAEGSN